jgi:hypothetical protein
LNPCGDLTQLCTDSVFPACVEILISSFQKKK